MQAGRTFFGLAGKQGSRDPDAWRQDA